ncbi:MAG TPA: ATP-binding protein, partial [Polyangiaceae bacterium]|nr:ATP-binding protein [Polyangiaceae bacterium]
ILMFRAYRSGKREALSSLIGAGFVSVACLNDVLLVTSKLSHNLYLTPHAFSLYAFGVASTLLFRYQAAAGQLELTTSSLRTATEELRHSHDELRQVQDELTSKQQLATVGELAAAIAHEVRNPLAVIVNAVAGLRRAGMGEDDRKVLLDIVDEEAARLNRLVTDLLRFARPVTVQRSAVSLVELAHRAESLAREGHVVSVAMSDDPDVKTVWVDPGLFRLVFDNLVENALQSMPGGGTVMIEIRRGDWNGAPCVRVEIRDQGQGMEPEVLERAVDPFFTTRPSGTGLGLPIVQRIIEAHGGDIEIESEAGAGTSVILLLPMGEPQEIDLALRLRTAARA